MSKKKKKKDLPCYTNASVVTSKTCKNIYLHAKVVLVKLKARLDSCNSKLYMTCRHRGNDDSNIE